MAGEENNSGSGGTGGENNAGGTTETQVVPSIPIADLKAAGIGDAYFDDKGNLNTKSIVEQLAERNTLKTANEERAKLVPANGAYSFDLPKEFEAPKGMEWKPDPGFTKELATAFKDAGLTQADVNKLIPVYAKNEMRKMAVAQEAVKTELGKLGADAPKRLETIGNAAIGLFGEKLGKALIASDAMSNADTVLALEKFINDNGSKLASNSNAGGGGSNNAALAELAGKPGGGRKLLEAANAAKK